MSAGLQNVLKRPPSGNAFVACKGVSTMSLDPGVVKKCSVHDGGSMYFNTFMKLVFQDNFQGAATGVYDRPKFGSLQMFCFQKRMRTGTGTSVVTVGYQHEVFVKLALLQSRPLNFIREFNSVA